MTFDSLLIEAVTRMNATSNLFREKVNIRWLSSALPFKRRKIMLNKSVLSVFFIFMLAATFGFSGDQLNNAQGEAAGINPASLYQGYIVRLQWVTTGTAVQLKMTVKSFLPNPSPNGQVFMVNTQTLININGRLAGPKELVIGDVVTVTYDQNYIASKVTVRRPGTGNIVRMSCKIEEIRFSGPYYVFVMEKMGGEEYYYDLIVTRNSKLIRNGKPADASEFQPGDVGTANFYFDSLKIVSFISISTN